VAGGERIPLVARIMHLANELEVHALLHRAEAAVAMADYCAGGAFDPHLVWLFCQASGRLLEVLEARSPWEAAMAADPVAGLVEAAASGLGLPIDEVKFSAPSFSRSVAAWNLAVRG
jgi:hypothetical protein